MAEQHDVTAHDWVRGIFFSVLASLIGGASKLSIRKSWLIDARREGSSIESSEVNTYQNQSDYDNNNSIENEGYNTLAPLEVASLNPGTEDFSLSDDCIRRRQEEDNDKSSMSDKHLSWLLYVSGMIGMSFLNPLCCILAMQYANPSILAPFSGLTLVWIILLSGVVVGEYPGWSQKVACLLIVTGEVFVALFGDHTNDGKDIEDVISSYEEPAFHYFFLVMTLFLFQLGIVIWIFPKESLLKKTAWGTVGGSITGFQNFLKDALTILDAHSKQSGDYGTLPPVFYLFILLSMFTSFSGLLCLSACMKRYDATYSSAMFVVSFVVVASFMSGIHYHTFEHLDGVLNYVMYPLGLATLFLGAYVLVKPTSITGVSSDRERNSIPTMNTASIDEMSYRHG